MLCKFVLYFIVVLIVVLVIGVMLGFAEEVVLSAMQRNIALIGVEYASRFGVDSSLVLGICWVESRLGLYNYGDDGKSLGVMQVRLGTLKHVDKLYKLGLSERYNDNELRNMLRFNVRFNILIGVLYLKWLVSKMKDYRLAVDAYNKGFGKVKGIDSEYVKMVVGKGKVLDRLYRKWYMEKLKIYGKI